MVRMLRVSLMGLLISALSPLIAYAQSNVAVGIWWEPSIALDPTDTTHQHLILGNGFELQASTDGGATFTTLAGTTNDLPGGGSVGDGTVAFDSKGNLYWLRLAVLNGIQGATVALGGKGSAYKVGDTLTVKGGNNGTVQVTSVGPHGGVTGIAIQQSGSGYSNGFQTTGGNGSGCVINVSTVSSTGAITGATASAGGSGYQVNDTLTVVENRASAGTVQVTSVDSNGGVTGITISTGGTGYRSGFATTGGSGSGCEININAITGWQAALEQINASTGAQVGQTYYFPSPSPWYDDKPWIAADANSSSPYADSVYAVWSRDVFSSDTDWFQLYFSKYDPVAKSWSTPAALTDSTSCSVWPATVAVAKNGDVFITYQTCSPAEVEVLRSTDGGESFLTGASSQQPMTVIASGQDNFNGNSPGSPPVIPDDSDNVFAPTGAFLVPDDTRAGQVYVVANTTPSSDPTSNIVSIVTGICQAGHATQCTWSAPSQLGDAPPGTIQIMPIASSDGAGNIIVKWYDTRDGYLDAAGNYEFSVYATMSYNGGMTWVPDFELSQNLVAVPDTNDRHLGEYTALAGQQGMVYAAWIDPNNAGTSPCTPGCFQAFHTAVAKSLHVTASSSSCGNAWVSASVTDGLTWVGGQQIQFSAPPGYTLNPATSSTSNLRQGYPVASAEASTEVINPNVPGPVSVWIKATDVNQPPPMNSSGAVVTFAGTIRCKPIDLPKCILGICEPYVVPGVVSISSLLGSLKNTVLEPIQSCLTAPCTQSGSMVDYTTDLGEGAGTADFQMKKTSSAEASRVSSHVSVTVMAKESAAALLQSNPSVVSGRESEPGLTFVGPVFQIKADSSVAAKDLTFDSAFSYSKALPKGSHLEVMRLVETQSGGRWLADPDITITKTSRLQVSARTVGPGTFVIVARPAKNELHEEYSHRPAAPAHAEHAPTP